MMADTDPLEYRQRSHPDLEVESHGLTLWDLDREFATGSFGGEGRVHEAAHDPRHPARLLLPHHRHRVHAHPGPRAAPLDPGARRAAAQKPPREEQLRILLKLNQAEAFETFLQTKFVGQKRFSLEGGETTVPLIDEICEAAAEAGARRGHHRHGAPRPAQRARQHRRQELQPDLPRVRGQHRPAHRAGLRRREVPPRRRGRVRLRLGRQDQGLRRREPVAPRGGRPGARGHRPRQAGRAQPGRRASRCCRCSCTATRRSPARAWSPRR